MRTLHARRFSRLPLYAAVVAAAALVAVAHSETATTPLSRAQAVDEARTHSPEIRALNAAIASARGDAVAAAKWNNPELGLAPGMRVINPGGNEFHGVVELKQEILFPGKRDLRRAVADKNVAIQELALAGFQNQLATEVRHLYDTFSISTRAVKLYERRVAVSREFLEAARKKVSAGVGSQIEATRAEVDVVNAQKTLRDGQAQAATARAALNTLLGRDPLAGLELADSASVNFDLPPADTLMARIVAANPALRVQQMAAERAGLAVESERKERLPDFIIGPSIEYLKDEQTYDFSIAFPLPLWDHRSGEIAAATAEKDRALAEHDKLKQEILRDAGAAYESTAAAREALSLITPDLRARLVTAMDESARGYAEGRMTLLAYVEMQRTFYEMQTNYIESLQNLIDARAALETAAGVPLETLVPEATK
ncbi:MAG TPA: TolC family protein [Candidatus Krumholzibacteria bacterium]|nr:TolC family protein [Candidatus Krumholzibacteria bacterium]